MGYSKLGLSEIKSKKTSNVENNDNVLVEEDDRYVLNSGDGIMMNNSVDKPI